MNTFIPVAEIERDKKERRILKDHLSYLIGEHAEYAGKGDHSLNLSDKEFLCSHFWVKRPWFGQWICGSFHPSLIQYCIDNNLTDEENIFEIVNSATFNKPDLTMNFLDPKSKQTIAIKAKTWIHVSPDCSM